MGVGKSGFTHILRVFTPNKSDKAQLQKFYKFKCDDKGLTPIWEDRKKRIKKKSNFSVGNKKYYIYNKINHFAQDCRLKNFVNRNKTFTNITQQLNIIKKEYFTKILNPRSES